LEMKQSCRKHSFVDSRQPVSCMSNLEAITLKKVEVNAAGGHSKGNEQQLQCKTDPFVSINDSERNRPQPRQLVASSPSESATCSESRESIVLQYSIINVRIWICHHEFHHSTSAP
jgi:hypothetical protein